MRRGYEWFIEALTSPETAEVAVDGSGRLLLYADRTVVVLDQRPEHLDDLLRDGVVPEQWLDDLNQHRLCTPYAPQEH